MPEEVDKDAERKAQAARAKKLLAAKRKKKAEAESKAPSTTDSIASESARPSLDERRPALESPVESVAVVPDQEQQTEKKRSEPTAITQEQVSNEVAVQNADTLPAAAEGAATLPADDREDGNVKAEDSTADDDDSAPLSKSQKKKRKAQEKEKEKERIAKEEEEKLQEEQAVSEEALAEAVPVEEDVLAEADVPRSAIKHEDLAGSVGDGLPEAERPKDENQNHDLKESVETVERSTGSGPVRNIAGPSPSAMETHAIDSAEVAEQEKATETLRSRMIELETTVTALESKIAELETQKSQWQTDLNLLSEAQGHITTLEADLASARDTLQNQNVELERAVTLETELKTIKDSLERTEGEARDARRRTEELEVEIEELQGNLRTAEEEGKERQRDLEERMGRERERESMLEGELRRVQQSCTDLEIGKAAIESELAHLKQDHSVNMEKNGTTEKALTELSVKHEELSTQYALSQTRVSELGSLVKEARSSSASAEEEMTSLRQSKSAISKELEQAQSQLAKEVKRAEKVTEQRQALQTDNKGLLEQLDEMKGRIGSVVEEREAVNGKLLEERSKAEQLQKRVQDIEQQHGDLTVEYDIIVTERDSLAADKKELGEQRRMLAEKVDQYKRQINEHQELQQGLAAELESTDVSQAAFISRIREINSKWQEAERNIVSMTENNSVEEAISDLKSQHALEVSERDSEARKLADELHEQFAQSHRLAKQVADLESELTALRGGIRVPREKSNVAAMSPRRPTALQSPRGASYTHTPSPIVPSSASIDSTLPPSVRYKRQVSLAMLKARMSGPPPSLSREHGDDRSMHALIEEGQADDADLHYPKTFRSQVSDEAIFWCPECHGDLITL